MEKSKPRENFMISPVGKVIDIAKPQVIADIYKYESSKMNFKKLAALISVDACDPPKKKENSS